MGDTSRMPMEKQRSLSLCSLAGCALSAPAAAEMDVLRAPPSHQPDSSLDQVPGVVNGTGQGLYAFVFQPTRNM